MRKHLSILFLALMAAVAANARLKLASPLTDNMVLQQNSSVTLWGEAKPGSTLVIIPSWQKQQRITTTVPSDGKWKVKVKTPAASLTEYTISFEEKETPAKSSGNLADKAGAFFDKVGNSINEAVNGRPNSTTFVTLSHILIGEVWIASGQSNMEMPLEGFAGCSVKDGMHDAMMAAKEAPYVRMFNVKRAQTMAEQEYCGGEWQTTSTHNQVMTFESTPNRDAGVRAWSAVAYYFASALSNTLNIPVGIINTSYGGAHVESWSSKELCEQYPDIPTDSVSVFNFGNYDFDRPMLMYNAMFCPIKNFTCRGVIWYQGCSNIGQSDEYVKRLTNMINLWRSSLGSIDTPMLNGMIGGEAIPFYQVEIAPYQYGENKEFKERGDLEVGALIREAQMKVAETVPNCGIVSTNDLVEPYERWNIHPRNKRTVGDRLALLALNKTYGFIDIVCEGPKARLETFQVKDGVAKIGLASSHKGVCCEPDIKGIELAGADRKFYPAKATFDWRTNEISASCDEVPVPVAMRYCFRDWMPGGTIKGGNELPCFPFRTDKW